MEAHERNSRLTVCSHPLTGWPSVRPIWKDIAQKSPYTSFFLTPDWVDSWITVFGQSLNTEILTFQTASGTAVGCCLLVSRIVKRGPFSALCIFLNTTGEDDADSACMECNTLLCLEGWEASAAEALLDYMSAQKWDIFSLQGCFRDESLSAVSRFFSAFPQESKEVANHYVDLKMHVSDHCPYESSLSSNSRSQIRKSIRLYEESMGGLCLDSAPDTESALNMMDELAELHQTAWNARGKPGSFGSRNFVSFHRELIKRMYLKGNIELIRISAGSHILGLVYNFLYRGRVYYYQSGFSYHKDSRLKPGLTAHYLLIEHYLRRGFLEYDFLTGDSRYKKSLANSSRDLSWITVNHTNTKMKIIGSLRAVKKKYARLLR